MNAKEQGIAGAPGGKPPARWKSSLYAEPTWVSLAWILGPALFAGIAIYLAIR